MDHRIARLAAAGYGVFTRDAAMRAGATEGMIQVRLRSGRWIVLYQVVYLLAGTAPSMQQAVLAACFACGDSVAASHAAAGNLWRVPGIPRGGIEVSVPRGRRRRARGIVVHETKLPRTDVTKLGPIPITTPTRTLIDLAARLSPERLEVALDDALRRELVTVDAIRRRIATAGRRRGIGELRELVAARDPGGAPPQSPLETRFARLIRQSRLPEPVRQYEVTDGHHRAFLDFAWPDAWLAVEVDGYAYHSGRDRWESDRARQNRLTLLGWRVIHVTDRDMQRPEAVLERVSSALGLG